MPTRSPAITSPRRWPTTTSRRVKRRVIHTGVDAEGEFNPDLIAPAAARARALPRAVRRRGSSPQKDPQLMLDVAAAVVAQRPRGPVSRAWATGRWSDELRRRTADARASREHVRFHGPKTDVRPWYAACDALLMTSTFEGIPVAIFEAMAMRLPVVAPALPGIAELVGDGARRADRAARRRTPPTCAALVALATTSSAGWRSAERARERVRERFGVERMAAAHEALYDELLEVTRRDGSRASARAAAPGRHRPRARKTARSRAAGRIALRGPAEPRAAARLGHRAVLQPRAVPARLPAGDPRAGLPRARGRRRRRRVDRSRDAAR